jgi:hypothetical protein
MSYETSKERSNKINRSKIVLKIKGKNNTNLTKRKIITQKLLPTYSV